MRSPINAPILAIILALSLGGATCSAAAADAPSNANANANGDLTVRASGFAPARGHAVAKLFITGDNVLEAGRWQVAAPIDNGLAAFHFAYLPAGTYAVVVFHDENDNGKIDHGMLGPSEPLGFSGGFTLSLFSGRPDFERLKFAFNPPEQTLEVRMR
ncbi:MAG: DUF2141 domain-containing protein [Rhodoferax sp.]|nr:DUF2141 domain-containing protein [Rhodoferax sp.]MDP3652274.1 DUF2141 domain-containing protein [Rhodoferax sp.]